MFFEGVWYATIINIIYVINKIKISTFLSDLKYVNVLN